MNHSDQVLVIECRNLVKTYKAKPPVEALRGIDLEVNQGECFGVLGPNGAGKTTAIEIMEGLLEPSGGEVQILGHSWDAQADAIRQRIGISLQETRFSDKLTVLETLRLFRSFYARGRTPEEANFFTGANKGLEKMVVPEIRNRSLRISPQA